MPWAKYLVQYWKTDRRVANRQITINTSSFLLRKKIQSHEHVLQPSSSLKKYLRSKMSLWTHWGFYSSYKWRTVE